MQTNDFAHKERSACSVKNSPVPESMICPKCSSDVEIWTDEDETSCDACGKRILKK